MTSQLERELRRRAELNRRLGERSFLSRKISIPETERGCELLMGALKRSNDSIEKALNSIRSRAETSAPLALRWTC